MRAAAPLLALALALMAQGACGKSALGKPETFNAEEFDGSPASIGHVRAAVEILQKRFKGGPYADCDIEAADGAVIVRPPKKMPEDQLAAMRRLVVRPGRLEMRAAAPADMQPTATQEKGPAPAGWAWAADAQGERLLIEVPEHGKTGDDRVRALRERVFTDADLAEAAYEKQGSQHVVTFKIREPRKDAFTKLTKELVNRQLAILVEGVVLSAPTVKIPLPGQGVITGGGTGFKPEEARQLAVVLNARRLPVHIFTEEPETPPAPAAVDEFPK